MDRRQSGGERITCDGAISPTLAPQPCWDRQAAFHNRLGEQRRVDRREFGPGVPLQIVVDRDDSFDMRGFARPISALGSFRIAAADIERAPAEERSEEHTSELQSLMRT